MRVRSDGGPSQEISRPRPAKPRCYGEVKDSPKCHDHATLKILRGTPFPIQKPVFA